MPDDIIDAAQKAINDAAKTADPSSGDTTTKEATPTTLPPEPEPQPVVPQEPSLETPPPPAPTADSLNETKETVVNELLKEPIVPSLKPAAPSRPPPAALQPKKKSKAGIVAVIAALLLTLPVAVYYISQQNQQIADIRNRATGNNVYVTDCSNYADPTCNPDDVICAPSQDPNTVCGGEGRQCSSYNAASCPNCRNGNDCCSNGYYPCDLGSGCCKIGAGGDDTGGDDTAPTATPTTGNTPVCQNIKVYKGNTQVTDLSTLHAGDTVSLRVKGNLAPTNAHFRINGGSWTETSTKNASDEWTLDYTIPEGVADFVIEGEVFTNGAWH